MKQLILLAMPFLLFACGAKKSQFDAEGNFEADETIVSSELPGRLIRFSVDEGDTISAGTVIGKIDAVNISLQKEQVEASINALNQKTLDVRPQIKLLQDQLAVQQTQLQNLLHEQARIERLVKLDAATGKQLDDIRFQVDAQNKQMAVTRQQINVQENNTGTQNRSVLSEAAPLEKRVAQLNDQIQRSNITNPVKGTVTAKYAEEGEVAAAGKALYKIADLSYITLRAYVTGDQLSAIKLGQSVKVFTDKGKDAYTEYAGTITWISDKAEFTPKTIQTKDERANLVYAVKIRVKNNGLLKIGMYGEIKFQ
jgi:HlyD family secretion protein